MKQCQRCRVELEDSEVKDTSSIPGYKYPLCLSCEQMFVRCEICRFPVGYHYTKCPNISKREI